MASVGVGSREDLTRPTERFQDDWHEGLQVTYMSTTYCQLCCGLEVTRPAGEFDDRPASHLGDFLAPGSTSTSEEVRPMVDEPSA